MSGQGESSVRIPWPGPVPYAEGDSRYFFGREIEIGRVLNLADSQRISALTAPSAAGKTSVLRAGILPSLRRARLVDLEQSGAARACDARKPFPVYVGKWTGKGESAFAEIVAAEAYKAMQTAMEGIQSAASFAGDPAAIKRRLGKPIEVERVAVESALARLGDLCQNMTQSRGRGDFSEGRQVDLYLQMLDVLVDEFGSIVVVLDQFEEILRTKDSTRPRRVAIESVRRCYLRFPADRVRVLLAMRHDFSHLLEPLEGDDMLTRKRFARIEAMTAGTVRRAVQSVADMEGVGISFDAGALGDLIKQFTVSIGDGASGPDGSDDAPVNLLGLQVVLSNIAVPGASVSVGAFDKFLNDNFSEQQLWEAGNESLVMRSWLESCLDRFQKDSGDAWRLPLSKALFAEMAELLVAGDGTKREASLADLRAAAYGRQMGGVHTFVPAGAAFRESWGFERTLAQAQALTDDLLGHLESTNSHVLKVAGFEGEDIRYELVHDGFSQPLLDWAKAFKEKPAARLHRLWGVRDDEWVYPDSDTGVTMPRTPAQEAWRADFCTAEGVDPCEGLAWGQCAVIGADFRGVTFSNCDFSLAVFRNCHFGASPELPKRSADGARHPVFDACNLDNAVFFNCYFADGAVLKSNLMNTVFGPIRRDDADTHCEFERMTFRECRLRNAVMGPGTCLKDSSFLNCGARIRVGEEGAPNVGSLEVISGHLRGTVSFGACDLPGFSLITPQTVGDLTFERTLLRRALLLGQESAPVDMRGHRLQITDCDLDDALISSFIFGDTADGEHGEARFERVDLGRSALRDCVLAKTTLTGGRDDAVPSELVNAEHLVLRNCTLDCLSVSHYQLDSGVFQANRIVGECRFEHCSMRCLGVFNTTAAADGRLVVESSDVSLWDIAPDSDLDAGFLPAGLTVSVPEAPLSSESAAGRRTRHVAGWSGLKPGHAPRCWPEDFWLG